MRKNISFYFLFLALINIVCCCTFPNNTSNRSYFTFYPEDRKIIVPVQLNDSIRVKLVFDLGFSSGYIETSIVLDSSVLSVCSDLTSDSVPILASFGSAWNNTYAQRRLKYNSKPKLNIGNTDLNYARIMVTDWKRFMNNNLSDGMFNIPRHDTTHIWELNFENNYMEIHPADHYTLPGNCFVMPLTGPDIAPFCIDLPLQVKFMNNDTLTLKHRTYIDTGASWDIILLHKAPELEYLNKREDAVWLEFLDSYIRYYPVNATLSEGFTMDSVRIYTIDYQNGVNCESMIGLNFLKRFNVFFDMKNRQLGLQPIKNFQRWVNPLFKRFHYSTQKTSDGKFIVNVIGDYKENYYKTAGLQVGDEITSVNGTLYGEVTREMSDEFKKRDTVTLGLIRNGEPLSLVVKINPNEPVGD